MMRDVFFKVSLVLSLAFPFLKVSSQQVNTLYFMENVPVRHNLNPAFQPYSNFYFGLPVLGYSQFGFINNSITLKNLVYNKDGQSIIFLNSNRERDRFYNTLKNPVMFLANMDVNLVDFGFRKRNSFWSFSLSERIDAKITLPKELMKFILYGTPDAGRDNVFSLTPFAADITAYSEAALGYSIKLNDQWNVGAKMKFLYGTGNMSLSNRNLTLTAGLDQWTFKGINTINYSSPAELTNKGLDSIGFVLPSSLTDWFKPSGLGGGIDLGFTYKPINQLTLSAALVDLGMIAWHRNNKNLTTNVNFAYNGLATINTDLNLNFKALTDSVFDALKKSITTTTITTNNNYSTYLTPKLNIGAEYSFFDNQLSVGLLSRTTKQYSSYFEELTASVNGRPTDWFNMSLSYSLLNGRMSNIGTGIGLRTGFLNWFVAADYCPFSYAKLPMTINNSSFNAPIPYNTKGLNLSLGVNLVFGNKKDADRDGVVDKRDLCPETPFGVIVDKNGCPIDADGDGVPDYLDKCPKTPKEAYNRIDQNGCPVDNDGDGVPDYLDKCPDTPKEAIGFVDKSGCMLDTDNDGIYDFKDKCPETPIGVKVDSIGCPLDSDMDGVPDYKDKCPETLPEARNSVDSLGCPIDKDLDGVPDYLDKCPDTPAAERNMVGADGCTIQKTIGVLDANTKPFIKKEVQTLLHKALQGVQFEAGKSTILPVSYRILNQIAGVMIANPNYNMEINGYTDNIGNPVINKKLSENRAKEVMKYLLNRGVATNRLKANGYGDTKPVATNKTAAGRANNRRVEFIVVYHEISFE